MSFRKVTLAAPHRFEEDGKTLEPGDWMGGMLVFNESTGSGFAWW